MGYIKCNAFTESTRFLRKLDTEIKRWFRTPYQYHVSEVIDLVMVRLRKDGDDRDKAVGDVIFTKLNPRGDINEKATGEQESAEPAGQV